MAEVLLFRLAGLMAAFGEVAVGDRRATWPRPSKSAVLGLVAGALGWDRTRTEIHQTLHQDLGFAVRVDAEGLPLRDYHTVQIPEASQEKGFRKQHGRGWQTRADELAAPRHKVRTKLTERHYLLSHVSVVGLWSRGATGVPLAQVAEALRHPVYPLFLGRRCCPLAVPVHPVVTAAADIPAAFAAYRPPALPAGFGRITPGRRLFTDTDAPLDGLTPQRVHERRDGLPARDRWTFSIRQEWELVLEEPS